ncbi:MAG: MATE family efflux transporter [Synechococcus sp.]
MIVLPMRDRLRDEIREFLKLAIPLASAQVAQSATGFADTVMMGRMGPDVLAAGGLAAIIYMAIMTTLGGVVMGVSPLVAEAFGAGNTSRIEQVTRQGLWLALLVSLPVAHLTGHLDGWMLRAGQSETTVELADTYLDIIQWSLFPVAGFTVLRAMVSALSRARPVSITIVVGTVFNIFGNYALGFGKFGFPAMGLEGLALATVLAWWGMFAGLGLYVWLHPSMKGYRVFGGLRRIRLGCLRELAWVGIPIGLFSGLESGFFMTVMLMVGTLGTDVLAAHQVVLQTIVVVFMVPLGISFATTVRVGQWLGRRDVLGIRQAAWVSTVATASFMAVVSVVFLLFPEQIIGIYLDVNDPANARVVALAVPLLMVAALAQVMDGLQKTVYGSLQGLQDTRVPMVLNAIGFWGIGLSLGYVLGFRFGMGSVGLWIGQSVAVAVVASLFMWRFQRLVDQRQRGLEGG